MLSSKDAKELDLPERLWNNNADSDTINKASNLMNSKKYVIIHPKESSTDLLAHEMGHIISDSGKAGRFRKWVSHRKANSLDGRGEFLENIFDDKTKNPLKSIKRIIRSGFINSDERAATKNALKLLKDNGATQEQIKEASDFLKKAGDTYKIGSKSYIKSPINNFVNRKKKR